MTWWSSHGRTVVTVAALWLVFNDPIDRWLPVPMPDLKPGPTTTWLAKPPLHEGRPDFAAAIDATDGERLAAGAAGWQALRQVMTEGGLAEAIAQHRKNQPSLIRGNPPSADAASRERAPALLALAQRLGSQPALAVPAKAHDESGSEPILLLRAPDESSALLLLAANCQQVGSAAVAAGDAVNAMASADTLVRLSSLLAGIDDVASHAGARRIRGQAYHLVVGSLATRIADQAHRDEAAAFLRRWAPLPSADAAFRRNARLLTLRLITGLDRSLREGTTRGALAGLRTNYPPDVNDCLTRVNGWFDAADRILPAVLDDAALRAFAPDSLPVLDDPDQARLPLANTMLFNPPMTERRRAAAGWVAEDCVGVVTVGLSALGNAARADVHARKLLAHLLAVPAALDPTAYAAAIRQRFGNSADANGFIEVTVDGGAVVIRPTSDVPGIAPLRIVLPSPP